MRLFLVCYRAVGEGELPGGTPTVAIIIAADLAQAEQIASLHEATEVDGSSSVVKDFQELSLDDLEPTVLAFTQHGWSDTFLGFLLK